TAHVMRLQKLKNATMPLRLHPTLLMKTLLACRPRPKHNSRQNKRQLPLEQLKLKLAWLYVLRKTLSSRPSNVSNNHVDVYQQQKLLSRNTNEHWLDNSTPRNA